MDTLSYELLTHVLPFIKFDSNKISKLFYVLRSFKQNIVIDCCDVSKIDLKIKYNTIKVNKIIIPEPFSFLALLHFKNYEYLDIWYHFSHISNYLPSHLTTLIIRHDYKDVALVLPDSLKILIIPKTSARTYPPQLECLICHTFTEQDLPKLKFLKITSDPYQECVLPKNLKTLSIIHHEIPDIPDSLETIALRKNSRVYVGKNYPNLRTICANNIIFTVKTNIRRIVEKNTGMIHITMFDHSPYIPDLTHLTMCGYFLDADDLKRVKKRFPFLKYLSLNFNSLSTPLNEFPSKITTFKLSLFRPSNDCTITNLPKSLKNISIEVRSAYLHKIHIEIPKNVIRSKLIIESPWLYNIITLPQSLKMLIVNFHVNKFNLPNLEYLHVICNTYCSVNHFPKLKYLTLEGIHDLSDIGKNLPKSLKYLSCDVIDVKLLPKRVNHVLVLKSKIKPEN